MDSPVDWIGVAVLVGVGLIVPIQAKEGSLDVATLHRASTACAVLLTPVAVAVFSLSVLGPPVQAQDNLSAQERADLRARAEAGAHRGAVLPRSHVR